jgi:type IV secretory pathway TrbF-like protein
MSIALSSSNDVLRKIADVMAADPSAQGNEDYTTLYRLMVQFRAINQQVIVQAQRALNTYDIKRTKARKAEESRRRSAEVYKGNPYTR